MLEKTIGRGPVTPFEEMQVVQHLLPVQFQWATIKMKHHMGETARVIGKGTLALAGQFDRTLQLLIVDGEIGNLFTGPFDKGTTFFS